MTPEQEPQPLADASPDELRAELVRTEEQLVELREQVRQQRADVGDTSRDVGDQADMAQVIQQVEQTEEILATVQQRHERLQQRLNETT